MSNTNNKDFEELHFKIEGGFLTEHFRKICLNGEWSKALSQLQESLIGFPSDYAISILSGEAKLEGVNSLLMEEDHGSLEYKNELLLTYGNAIYVNNKWYESIGFINSISLNSELSYERARIYCPTYDILQSYKGGVLALIEIENYNPPIWLINDLQSRDINSISIDQLMFSNRMNKEFEIYGIINDNELLNSSEEELVRKNIEENISKGFLCKSEEIYDFMKLDFVKEEIKHRELQRVPIIEFNLQNLIAELREKILIQAEENGGFLTITEENNDEQFIVPRAPFLEWCFNHGNSKLYLRDFAPEWNPVSPSGLKMQGDCKYHTDFVIGAGFDPRDFYRNQDFKNACFKYLHRVLDFDIITICGQGSFTDSVLKVTEDTNIEDCANKIIVIPHAGVEYFEYAKVAALTVTEVGGEASHLAINSAEFNINLILIDNASKLYSSDIFTFDLDNQLFSNVRVV